MLMSMRKYAKHRGVTPEAVSRAVKRGRITCRRDEKGQALIDPEVADREWSENSDPTKFRNAGAENRVSKGAKVIDEPEEAEPSPSASDPKRPNVRDAAAVLKAFQARLAKLDYEERVKKVVDAEEVKQRWLAVASIVRTKVLGIPAKAKQRCPDLTVDQYSTLEMIVREALEELSDE